MRDRRGRSRGRGPAPAARRSRFGRRGFTLVELVLVVAILGVVAAMVWPRYAVALASYRLDAAARRVASDLQLARSQARRTSAPATLSVSGSTYTISGLTRLDPGGGVYSVDLSADPYRVVISAAEFGAVPFAVPNLTIDGRGMPTTAGRISIRHGGQGRRISIDLAGLVTVREE